MALVLLAANAIVVTIQMRPVPGVAFADGSRAGCPGSIAILVVHVGHRRRCDGECSNGERTDSNDNNSSHFYPYMC